MTIGHFQALIASDWNCFRLYENFYMLHIAWQATTVGPRNKSQKRTVIYRDYLEIRHSYFLDIENKTY
jgi:hypothetical protein